MNKASTISNSNIFSFSSRAVWAALSCALLANCASIPSVQERKNLAESITAQRGWRAVDLPGTHFDLKAYVPRAPVSSDLLTIYIEGDGLAWVASDMPSFDPTPAQPIALRMALAQPEGTAAYLARPCQYTGPNARHCTQTYWTRKRFAPEVVETMNDAVSTLKTRFNAKSLQLVGYSGGGAIALLIASRRTDAPRVVTVAGNLDTDAWTRHHRITPLTGSLNPAHEQARLATVKQIHLSGSQDSTIPPQIAQDFASRFAPHQRPATRTLDGYTHHCCWAENWHSLWPQLQ